MTGGPVQPGAPARRALLAVAGAAAAACLGAGAVRQAVAQPAPASPAAAAVPGAQRHEWPRARPTPALALPALDGPLWRLADARGQVVLLNFWASWCEPCREELPSLELLAERHARDGVQVLAVNFREHETTIRRFLERQPMTLPVLRDADGAAARAWLVRIFPTTVAIARDGRAAFSVVGEHDWTGPEARRWLAALI